MKTNVIWIDPNVKNIQNRDFAEKIEELSYIKLKLFTKVDEAINYLKSLKFEETIVIVSGKPYSKFVSSFKKYINKMNVIPKIVVFTSKYDSFIKYNKDYENEDNAFYNFGGIKTTFKDLFDFIKKRDINSDKTSYDINNLPHQEGKLISNKYNVTQLMFEYINSKEKLILPLCFKSLIENISEEKIKQYINYLYDTYSKENNELKNILDILKTIPKIPIEILSKYFIRLYTLESNFYKNINKDLELNKINKHLPFIKILYEGIKLRTLPFSSYINLYCASIISTDDLNKIKYNVKNKINNLPSIITYTKSFLSFTKDKNIAEGILNSINNKNYLSKVLYIIDSNENINYNLSTHADIKNISFFPNDKEVLFFPFSSFEVKEINEINKSNETIYEIKLSYLGKYLEEIKNDKNIMEYGIKLPESDFKIALFSSGLINKEIIDNINTKINFNEYEKYLKEIEINLIFGEICVDNSNKYEDIQIINYNDYYYDNKKQIEENCEIKINGKKIKFSFKHRFEEEGTYEIEYIFKKIITNTSYMFSRCKFLTNLDLSNFNAKDVTNMEYMFENCKSLTSLNLANYITPNVTNMRGMFSGCNSLINLDLSNLYTKNVYSMYRMFDGCNFLKTLDLSNFNTQNVMNMDYMFADCSSLLNLDLSNFNIQNLQCVRNMLYNCRSLINFKPISYNMIDNNNFINYNYQNNNMLMNNNIMMTNNNNINPNNNPMINGNVVTNNVNNNIGMLYNNKDNTPNDSNSSHKKKEDIYINEHSHKLVYCVSILDWNCSMCKKNYSKSMGKYYCSLCDFNLCKKCHSERNLPNPKEFKEEIKPSNSYIKNPILTTRFHEHNLIFCRSSRNSDFYNNWYCDVCQSSFNNEIWSFYCTYCDFDLCCNCAGFN